MSKDLLQATSEIFIEKNIPIKGNNTNQGVTPLTLKFAILQKSITRVTSIRSTAGSASTFHR